MTRLHHRDNHLRRGHHREVIMGTIKIINRLVMPYVNAHFAGNFEFVGELFKAENFLILIQQLSDLIKLRENHTEYIEMTINTLRTLKMSYDCNITKETHVITIDNLITIIDEQANTIDRIQKEKGLSTHHLFTPIQFNMIVEGTVSWIFLVYHSLYGIPTNNFYDPTCLAKIMAGIADGTEHCETN